jgi:hypothetical protein
MPSGKAIVPDAVPDVTATPFTVIVELALLVVGVTVTPVVALVTASV